MNTRESMGFVLIHVVLLLGLLAAMSMLLNREAAVNVDHSAKELESDLAEYIVEAGLEHAVWSANNAGCTGYGLPSTPFEEHAYSAVFTPSTGSPVSLLASATLASGISRDLTRDRVRIYEPHKQTVVLQPDAITGEDTYIYEWKVTWNYGARSSFQVHYYWSNSRARGLLKFDLSVIPAEAEITGATLELFRTNSSDNGGTIDIRRLTAPWTEGDGTGQSVPGVTWNESDTGTPWTTAGGDFASENLSTADVAAGAGFYDQWDVTSMVAGWVGGKHPNHGLVMSLDTEGFGTTYASSDDGDETKRPKLTVTYVCECGVGPGGNLELQPDPSTGSDTYLNDGPQAANNYGDNTRVIVTNHSTKNRGLLKFDVSAIPAGANVLSAQLELELVEIGSANAGEVFVHRMTHGWTEMETTWDEARTGESWTTPGGDFEPTPAASASIDSSLAPHQTVLDVTSVVADWVGGAHPNDGLALTVGSGIDNANFFSSDDVGAATRPKLTVIYSCPCGVDCSGAALPFCEGDYEPNVHVGGFPLSSYSGHVNGITYFPQGLVLNGVSSPERGAWITVDHSSGKFLMLDVDGNQLDHSLSTPDSNLRGVALITSGPKDGLLAPIRKSATSDKIYFVNPTDGSLDSQVDIGSFSSDPDGITYIETTSSGVFDGHLAVVDSLDLTVYIVTQDGTLFAAIDISSFATTPLGVVHLPQTDKLLIADAGSNKVYIIDFTGTVLKAYDLSKFGFTGVPNAAALNPLTCDHVLGNAVGGGGGDEQLVYLNEGAAPTCDGTFRDEFNTDDYAGSDGTLSWSTDWREVGELDGPTSGDEQVLNDTNDFQLRVQDNDGGGEGVEREADLSLYGEATLSFDYRRDGLDNANDYVAIEVSNNGGLGWTEIDRLAGSATDGAYQGVSYDIGAFIAADTRIRFVSSSFLGNNDRVWFDNVEICVMSP